jgi:ubiquinone/menaquinone biosynthesis C-methylase UbiE
MDNSTTKADIMLEIRLETAENSQQAYDDLYTDVGISQPHSFYLWMMEILALQADDVYLDISCGRGELVAMAQARGVQAHGMDISWAALRSGQPDLRANNFVVCNAEQLPYADDSFSVASNMGSLEHFGDMKTAVQEMARVLKDNGTAVILVPNTFSLMTNIWIALRQGRTSIDDQPIQRYAARQEWQQLLQENGLTVEKTLKYEHVIPRTRQEWMGHLRHPKRILRLFLIPFIPLNLAYGFIFVCRKS